MSSLPLGSANVWAALRNQLHVVSCAICLLLMAPLASALVASTDLSQYGHRSWRYEEGYFTGIPLSIAQTNDGYLWIGTSDGLERFDGVRFVVQAFSNGESLPSLDIVSLLAARDGSLWIGTARGLARFAHGELTNYPAVEGDRILTMRESRDGAIWVVMAGASDRDDSLCRIKANGAQCFGLAQGLDPATAIALDGKGFVWLGSDTALERWSPLSQLAVRYPLAELRKNAGIDGVVALAVDRQGSLWVGMGTRPAGPGLLKFAHGLPEPFRHGSLPLNALDIHTLFLDGGGALWIGTAKNGIYRLANGRAENFQDTDGLTSPFVVGIFEDHEGNVWILTADGVDCFYDTPVLRLSKQEGLRVDEVDGLHATRSGEVLIGTAQGLKVLDTDAGTVHADTTLPNGQISGSYEDRLGQLWVGVDNRLYIQSGRRTMQVLAPDGEPFGLSVTTQDGTGVMWVEAFRRGQWHLNRIRRDHVEAAYSVKEVPPARTIVGDAQGGVWLGLRTGDLAHFDGLRLKVIKTDHGVHDTVHQIIVGPDGAILAGTTFGLVRVRGGLERTLTPRAGLPCLDVFSLVFDESGTLWAPAECGLISISARELARWWAHPETPIHAHLYDATEGVQAGLTSFQGAARSADGRLWFANGIDLETVDPAHLVRNSTIPPVHIERLIADRRDYVPRKNLYLPALTGDVEIDYTALSFVAPQKVRFKYILEQHDSDWIDALGRRQAFYDDLPPGRYTFRVIASNNDGVWNLAGATLSFSILPTYYQTVWFKIACALAAMLGLWVLYLVRVRQATAAVRMRFGERVMERERIARELHDTLLQGFQGLLLRFHAVLKHLPHPEVAKPLLESSLARGDQVLEEARRRVRDLLPDEDAPGDVSNALEEFGKPYAEGASVDYRVVTVGVPRELQPVSRREIIRTGREAITNAFLHARATKVVIEIHYSSDAVTLIVKDDGLGIPPDVIRTGRPGHWGLASMQAAAAVIGGTLSITDQDPSGTAVAVVVPARLAYSRARGAALLRLFKR